MTRDAFVSYYEGQHAPLIRSLLPGIVDYRRNYINRDGAFVFESAAPFDFDVVTELWWASRTAYEAAIAIAAQAAIAAIIATDEENFLDRAGTRMFLVEEHRSPE